MSDNKFCIDYAKRQAGCKKCKQKIEKGELRIAKVTPSPFSDDGEMKLYHHPACIFETFKRVRATTKVIADPGDLDGWDAVSEADQRTVVGLMRALRSEAEAAAATKKPSPRKKAAAPPVAAPAADTASARAPEAQKRAPAGDLKHNDNSFKEFRRLVAAIAETSSYNSKTEAVRRFFVLGSDGKGFKGDMHVWTRLLIPGVVKRVYNLQSKQLVKIFSRIFGASEAAMLEDLEQGDVAETIVTFLDKDAGGSAGRVASKSSLTVHDVDNFLSRLSGLTREDEQQRALEDMASQGTANDLKMIIRLIKADLRMTAGAKHVLDGLHPDAHESFRQSRNLDAVLDKVAELRARGTPGAPLDVAAAIMQPVQPMLAQACKSVDEAFKKCPNGMYAEIKYDGERVQLHKSGKEFKYYSRSLKPVQRHKVAPFDVTIAQAFPHASDIILDAEVLMVDNKSGKPLPFGTLGVHKKAGYKDATPCLFVFDCLYYNGSNLMSKPIQQRRELLQQHMVEVGNSVKFSEMKHLTRHAELHDMIKDVLAQGLEGLVLKDLKSVYEPGKRHWLKVKKDYLAGGAMADTADLVVLGAWYGTGGRGGFLSVFLMGCRDARTDTWCTVTKVGKGFDDATFDRLQDELRPNMLKIKGDFDRVPDWLKCTRQMTPDFVARDPRLSPVWEITGAEFSRADQHTADGISVRFPRVTRMRDDKRWDTATTLQELKQLYKTSKEVGDIDAPAAAAAPADRPQQVQAKRELKEEIDPYGSATDVDDSDEEKVETKMPVWKKKIEVKGDAAAAVVVGDRVPPVISRSEFSGKSFNKTRITTDFGLEIVVRKGDFPADASPTSSLVHVVTTEWNQGVIERRLQDSFPGLERNFRSSARSVGDAVVFDAGDGRLVYSLVVSSAAAGGQAAPSYEELDACLRVAREDAVARRRLEEITMPPLAAPQLSWHAVRTLTKNIFLRDKIKISVFSGGDVGDVGDVGDGVDGGGDGGDGGAKPGKAESKAQRLTSPAAAAKQPSPAARAVQSSPSPRKRPSSPSPRKRPSSPSPRKRPSSAATAEKTSSSAKKARSCGRNSGSSSDDCFDGCVVALLDGIAETEKLTRYVIAFGGQVRPSSAAGEDGVTHVVYAERDAVRGDRYEGPVCSGGRRVTEQWLVDSVKLKSLQDPLLYMPQL